MARTFNNLFAELASLRNLLAAAHKASLGKRGKEYVDRFRLDLEREVWTLRNELLSGSYRPGPYRTFRIHEPKTRLISAAPFRDRVVHHAVCNVLEPLWEGRFVSESFANRKGFGVSVARDHFEAGIRRYPWVLRCDVRKFFPSMDHAILKTLFRKVVGCRDTLALLDRIVDASNPQEPVAWHFAGDDLWTPYERPHGLPLGNQTSQFFANVFLDPLDHFVKETLRCPHYVRYVDDMAVFGTSKDDLRKVRDRLEAEAEGLRLRLHPGKTRVHQCGEGVTFLGIRFGPGGKRRLPGANVRRMRRRLRSAMDGWRDGRIERESIRRMWIGWRGHALQGGGSRLLEVLEQEAKRWSDSGETCVPRGSRRRVEQPSDEYPLRQSQQEPPREQEHR